MSHDVIASAVDNSAGLTQQAIAELNALYQPLTFAERIQQLYRDFAPEKVLVTSSFAATSAYFLHIISTLRPEQPIHFIDTGFHFPETLAYRNYLQDLLKLTIIDVVPDDYQHQYSVQERLYETDPDFCCAVNKVNPLEDVKTHYHVWVSSLMGEDTDHRSELAIFEERRGIIKFNPMIDVTHAERDAYIQQHQLPFHPLVAKGYNSIGCSHCTVPGAGRSGRWSGKAKTECGLHL